MRREIFLTIALVFIITSAFLFYYQTKESLLMVNVGLNLRIFGDSSHISGIGSISRRNTNVTLVEWPQIANESVDLNLKYAYNVTRSTPVHFIISLNLGNMENVLAISNITKVGEYIGSVSSLFSVTKPGMYDLTMTIWVTDNPSIQDQLNRLIMIP